MSFLEYGISSSDLDDDEMFISDSGKLIGTFAEEDLDSVSDTDFDLDSEEDIEEVEEKRPAKVASLILTPKDMSGTLQKQPPPQLFREFPFSILEMKKSYDEFIRDESLLYCEKIKMNFSLLHPLKIADVYFSSGSYGKSAVEFEKLHDEYIKTEARDSKTNNTLGSIGYFRFMKFLSTVCKGIRIMRTVKNMKNPPSDPSKQLLSSNDGTGDKLKLVSWINDCDTFLYQPDNMRYDFDEISLCMIFLKSYLYLKLGKFMISKLELQKLLLQIEDRERVERHHHSKTKTSQSLQKNKGKKVLPLEMFNFSVLKEGVRKNIAYVSALVELMKKDEFRLVATNSQNQRSSKLINFSSHSKTSTEEESEDDDDILLSTGSEEEEEAIVLDFLENAYSKKKKSQYLTSTSVIEIGGLPRIKVPEDIEEQDEELEEIEDEDEFLIPSGVQEAAGAKWGEKKKEIRTQGNSEGEKEKEKVRVTMKTKLRHPVIKHFHAWCAMVLPNFEGEFPLLIRDLKIIDDRLKVTE